ncbi:MAG: TonB-dependent receptor, partial [Bacteroidota bacterium]
SISVYGSEDFRFYNPRSLPEALIGTNGVWVQKTNHGGGSPFVRGLTGNQTLLLIDGIRLNNSTYRYGPNQYFNTLDVFSLEKAEILRGTGSVQYGTDALGGAIQLISKNPEFSAGGIKLSGNLYGKWMNRDMEKTLRADLNLGTERFAIHGGISFRDFGDLYAGGDLGTQAPSAYDEWATDIKAKFIPTKNHLLTLAFQKLRQENVGRYDQVAQRGYQSYFFDPQERSLTYARYTIKGNNNWANEINLTVSLQNSLEGRRKQRENSKLLSREEDKVDTWGATFELKSRFNAKWTASSGLEWYSDKVGSRTEILNTSTNEIQARRGLYPEGSTTDNLAIFSLHRFESKNWIWDAGLRYNIIQVDIQDDLFGSVEISPDALVGNLGLMYKLSKYQRIYGSINSGFRAPNINDLSSFGSFDSGIEVPTNSLQPERSYSGEIGYKIFNQDVAAAISVFYTSLNNLITRVPSTFNGSSNFNGEAVFTKANTAEAFLRGFEIDATYTINQKLEAYGRLAYIYGQDVSKDEPLRRMPPLNGMLGLNVQANANSSLRAEYLFAGLQDRLSGGDISDHRIANGGTPGWNLVNLYANYSLSFVQLGVGFQNVFNEAYRIHGSGVDGYGRSLWLSVVLAF